MLAPAVLGLAAATAGATTLLIEEFPYEAGTLLTDTPNWAAHSGAGTNPITVTEDGLQYPDYPQAGRAVSLTTSGEDDHTNTSFEHTSGPIYLAFLANASAAQTGDYFIHFYQASNLFYGRVFCRASGDSLNFGVTRGAGTANYASAAFPRGETCLVVAKYTLNSGTQNDTAELWVNPTVGPVEPPPLVSSTDNNSTDATSIAGIALRQGSSSSAATVRVDGIRVATSWEELFTTEATGACCEPSGICSITIEADCVYDWHPEWTTCAPNPCPHPPQGACCLTGAACVVTSEEDCVLQDGAWQGEDTSCSPNPCPFPVRTLCEVAEDDTDGVPLLLDQRVVVEGIAHVANGIWNPGINQFEISDGECCVSIFGDTLVAVQEGDLVRVRGTVDLYNGLTEITSPDLEITVLSGGHPVHGPGVVTTGELAANGEVYEACLISIQCAAVIDTIWPAEGENANLTIDDGTGAVTLRIDKDTNIDGSPRPEGLINITGVALQFDSSSPYSAGYQILPRSLADLEPCVVEPTGACCMPDGACTVTSETDCSEPNIWMGQDVPCEPNPCDLTALGDLPPASALNLRVAPTPFSTTTSLSFAGPPGSEASLIIVDAAGRRIRTAWAGILDGRPLSLLWDGRDDSGREVASGTYLARLQGGSKIVAQRVIKAR